MVLTENMCVYVCFCVDIVCIAGYEHDSAKKLFIEQESKKSL